MRSSSLAAAAVADDAAVVAVQAGTGN